MISSTTTDVRQRFDPVLRRGDLHGDLLSNHPDGGGLHAQRHVLHLRHAHREEQGLQGKDPARKTIHFTVNHHHLVVFWTNAP